MMFSKIRQQVKANSADAKRAEQYRDLIRREAEIGGHLFGPIPAGHRREFFCLDEHTWVWHEEWKENGTQKVRTTRYEVRPSGVVKIQDGHMYQSLSPEELHNLRLAADLYGERVINGLYSTAAQDQSA